MSTPQESVSTAEPRRQRLLDRLGVLLAVLLGLGAVATAFAAYQGEIYSGDSLVSINQSLRSTQESSLRAIEGNQELAKDTAIFLEYVRATRPPPDLELIAYYRESIFDDNLLAGIEWWEDSDALTPFVPENPRYEQPELEEATALAGQARRQFDRAIELDDKGDQFVLYTVLFATSLFLYGIASVSGQLRLKVATMAIGAVVFLLSVGLLAGTYFSGPQPFT